MMLFEHHSRLKVCPSVKHWDQRVNKHKSTNHSIALWIPASAGNDGKGRGNDGESESTRQYDSLDTAPLDCGSSPQ